MRKGKEVQRVDVRDEEGLTVSERVFVDAFVSTGDVEHAFKKAGIVNSTFRRLIGRAHVRNAVVLEAESRVHAHAFVAAQVLLEICLDKATLASTRVDAAKALRLPFLARLEKHNTSSGRTLAEHTIGELRALVSNLEMQRAEGALPVNGADLSASSAPTIINPDDLIG